MGRRAAGRHLLPTDDYLDSAGITDSPTALDLPMAAEMQPTLAVGRLPYVERRVKNILLGGAKRVPGSGGRYGDGFSHSRARLAPCWPGPSQFTSGSRMSTAR